ncbi:MAG: replication initiator protein [Microvirus sp.]|nr:MAG: replication initiator protein [Microvirus sp.]
MPCYHPIDAWKTDTGLHFKEMARGSRASHKIQIPCGKCIGCRKKRVRDWATRCMHEAQMHKENCFITLTYNDDNYTPTLEYEHFQYFMKRLRLISGKKIRYFAAGEYGTQLNRPHFHALLFGVQFHDLTPIAKNLYKSKALEAIWNKGYASVGEVNHTTASYVAKYTMKKISGEPAKTHYERVNARTGEIITVNPEFGHMSLKPGIGATWLAKYWQEVYIPRDGIILNGKTIPAPRYYDKHLQKINQTDKNKIDTNKQKIIETKKEERQIKAQQNKKDNTKTRLKVKETVAIAEAKHKDNRKL